MRVVLGLLFGLGLTIFWSYWKLPPEIPLSYSRPWGAAQLVPSAFLFFLAGGLVILTIVNSILAAKLSATDLILGRILAWVSALVVFLVDITLLRVVLLVT